jgi:hypothetical protein
MMLNKSIFLAGRKFDYICDININKNGNALYRGSFRGLKKHTRNISTRDNDEFCSFRIPSLLHWERHKVSGVYAICQTLPHLTVYYIGETDNLSNRFNMAYGRISKKHFNLHAAKINKKIYEKIEADNLLQIYFYNVPDEAERKEEEEDIIHKINPWWNSTYNGA